MLEDDERSNITYKGIVPYRLSLNLGLGVKVDGDGVNPDGWLESAAHEVPNRPSLSSRETPGRERYNPVL